MKDNYFTHSPCSFNCMLLILASHLKSEQLHASTADHRRLMYVRVECSLLICLHWQGAW